MSGRDKNSTQQQAAAQHWNRLQEEQEKAIQETQHKVQQLEKYLNDYKVLKDRLVTLPDKVKHDVMVPFGELAFMPGQIVHSNEVTVLLGDNWFAERSAKQAAEIAERRMEGVKEQISQLKSQEGLLEPRKEYTSGLVNMAKEQGNLVEIKEEYDEEKEKEWKERHKKSVQEQTEAREAQQRKAKEVAHKIREQKVSALPALEDADLWERLEQLELQEREEEQSEQALVEDTDHRPRPTDQDINVKKAAQGNGKTVRWKDDSGKEDEWCTDSEDDDEDGEWEEEEEEEESEEESDDIEKEQPPKVLYITHTKMEQDSDAIGSSSGDIVSPRDVFKQFVEPSLLKPKSILKRTEMVQAQECVGVDAGAGGDTQVGGIHVQRQKQDEKPSSVEPEAFGSVVRERVSSNQMVASIVASLDDVTPSTKKQSNTGTAKKVSKFKQRQMNVNK